MYIFMHACEMCVLSWVHVYMFAYAMSTGLQLSMSAYVYCVWVAHNAPVCVYACAAWCKESNQQHNFSASSGTPVILKTTSSMDLTWVHQYRLHCSVGCAPRTLTAASLKETLLGFKAKRLFSSRDLREGI